MAASEIGRAGIGEALKQGNGFLLDSQVFCVHQGHQPELTPGLLGFSGHPDEASAQARKANPLKFNL